MAVILFAKIILAKHRALSTLGSTGSICWDAKSAVNLRSQTINMSVMIIEQLSAQPITKETSF